QTGWRWGQCSRRAGCGSWRVRGPWRWCRGGSWCRAVGLDILLHRRGAREDRGYAADQVKGAAGGGAGRVAHRLRYEIETPPHVGLRIPGEHLTAIANYQPRAAQQRRAREVAPSRQVGDRTVIPVVGCRIVAEGLVVFSDSALTTRGVDVSVERQHGDVV